MAQTHTRVAIMRKVVISLFAAGLFELATYIKLSFIVGSVSAFFSINNIGAAMIGVLAGTSTGLFAMILRAIARSVLLGASPFSFIIYHIPGVCASAYWHMHAKALKITVPVVSMMLFCIHPVGGQAYLYTLYWLIPVTIELFDAQNIFLKSLAATFVAHAVGSVIWIYTVPMTVGMWYALIPIVPFERLVFALGMTAVYSVAHRIAGLWSCRRSFILFNKSV